MILYIIRHGQTDYNLTKRFQGKLDIPLNGTGIESAERVAAGMRDYPIDLVISSPLSRAVVTAEIVTEGRGVPLITDDRIMEISLGEWEGCEIYSGKDIPPEEVDIFVHDPLHFEGAPGGESFEDCIRRCGDFLDDIAGVEAYQDKHILISTHGAAGRSLLANFLPEDDRMRYVFPPPNCSMTTGELTKDKRDILDVDRIF